MQQPPFLQPGDRIAIVCTARSVSAQQLTPAVDMIRSWGLEFVLGESIGQEYHQFGGATAVRLADFQRQLDDPNMKAIWIARGGYGSIQLLDQIDWTGFLRSPKWIMGYSDVTLIHAAIQKLGVASMHCFMPLELVQKSSLQCEVLRGCLFGESPLHIQVQNSQKLPAMDLTSTVVGGNLSILYSLLGSVTQLNTQGRMLLIEEIDEYVYHLERMMYSLQRAGLLDGLEALLVGGMTSMNDHATPFGKNSREIIDHFTSAKPYPVVYDLPLGHVKPHTGIILGAPTRLQINVESCILSQPWEQTENI